MLRLLSFVWTAYLAWFCSTTFLFAAEPVTGKTGVSVTNVPNTPVAKPAPVPNWRAEYNRAIESAGRDGKLVVLFFPIGRDRSFDEFQVTALEDSKLALKPAAEPGWLGDYAAAWSVAEREGKMLLVFFCRPGECRLRERFERETLADPEVRRKLDAVVRVRLPIDASVSIEGKNVRLLQHPAFDEMQGLPGLAIVDLANKKSKHYGHVVSVFPFLDDRVCTAGQFKVILGLPSGSLTQRTLIYAVRTHPEHPESTLGRLDGTLSEEAECHAEYQARIRLQGHHFWESRFHRINRSLPSGCLASEVCAESWPGQGLLAAAIECVRCWRLSGGHWGAVSERHPVYGYDMKRGDNGIWYATGIFGRR